MESNLGLLGVCLKNSIATNPTAFGPICMAWKTWLCEKTITCSLFQKKGLCVKNRIYGNHVSFAIEFARFSSVFIVVGFVYCLHSKASTEN